MKFALVLMTLTCTLLVARVRALVKSAHMMPLKEMLRRRKAYVSGGTIVSLYVFIIFCTLSLLLGGVYNGGGWFEE
jgi:hypothetical protein